MAWWPCGIWTLSLGFGVRSNLPRQRRRQSPLVPKRSTRDPQAHKQLEFVTLLELGSVHALQVENMIKATVDRTRLSCS